MKHIIGILFFSLLLLTSSRVRAQPHPDNILGTYWGPKKDAKIQIYKMGERFFGKVIWGLRPEKDTKNPDPKLVNRELIGSDLFTGFKFNKSEEQWSSGKIYDPNDGKTYDCKLWLEDSGKVMVARGYIGISLFGRSARFERVK